MNIIENKAMEENIVVNENNGYSFFRRKFIEETNKKNELKWREATINNEFDISQKDFNTYLQFKKREKHPYQYNSHFVFIYKTDCEALEISNEIMEYLNYPNAVQIRYNHEEIVISTCFSDQERYFLVHKLKSKKEHVYQPFIIYSKELVISVLDEIGVYHDANEGASTHLGNNPRYTMFNNHRCVSVNLDY